MAIRTFVIWRLTLCSLLVVFSLGSSADEEEQLEQEQDRDGKFLKLFKVVRIPHQVCRQSPGTVGQTGSCYSMKECEEVNGEMSGTCAQGYGVCCLVRLSCSTGDSVTVRVNGTHLVNPPDLRNASNCRYRFPRPKDVCQLRLDFLQYVTDQSGPGISPNPNGDCNSDKLTFTGASNTANLGPLCGNLTGQHVILDYGSANEIDAFMYIENALRMMQNWDIQVTYIKCDSPDRAPTGCLQYFTEQTGTVKSFNYDGMQQLNNEDYSVCVKPIPGMNQITWRTCGGFEDFFISGLAPIMSPDGVLPPIVNPQRGTMCMMDWVMIYGVDKFCGNFLAGPVTSMTQPFMMQVHFDDTELGPMGDPNGIDDRNRGFCLMYTQSP